MKKVLTLVCFPSPQLPTESIEGRGQPDRLIRLGQRYLFSNPSHEMFMDLCARAGACLRHTFTP